VIITDFSNDVQINEQEYIKLKFNQLTINKIIHSLNNNENNNTGLFTFTANLKINSNDIDILPNNIYIKKIIKKPASNSGFWIRYNIVPNKNNKNLYQIISPFFKKFNIYENTRIIGINFGSNPDLTIKDLYNACLSFREIEQYNKIIYQYLVKDDWNSGKGWSPYHDWIEQNVSGLDSLFREWRITPGILFQNNKKLGYLTFHTLFNELIYEFYTKNKTTLQNGVIFEHIFSNILYSFKIYKDVMIKGVDNSNVISFLDCFQHRKDHMECDKCDDQDVKEFCFDPDKKHMIPINQDILTEITCDFLDNHQDHFRNIPDWMFRDEFYKKVYDYMASRILSSLDIQNIINNEKKYKKIKMINILVKENFLEFLNTWLTEHPQIRNRNTRELIIQDIFLKEDVIGKNQSKYILEDISNIKNINIIWKCYGNNSTGMKIQTGNEVCEFRIGMDNYKLGLILDIIQNWWRKNWKSKELLGDEFFLVNKLRDDNGNDNLSLQRKDFDLVVVDNLLIPQNKKHKKCYLIKLIDKNDNRLYSIRIDEPTGGILSHAKDIRTGCINKYKLALLACPGMRVHLRGTIIKEVYTDTTYFVPNYRLKRVQSIRITSGV
jgi:hypothetical protein